MKKRIHLIAIFFIAGFVAQAQQDPQYTNFMHYQLGFNPAFAGTRGGLNGMLINRYQWVGLKGAPEVLALTADASLPTFGNNSGVGINLVSDKIGFEDNTFINLNYAYHFSISLGDLSVGASLGLYNKNIDGEWYTPEGKADVYTVPGSDVAMPQDKVSQMAFDAGLGFMLTNNKYFAGLSVTHLNSSKIEISDKSSIYLARHYYLVGGYNIKLTDPLFEVRASALFKTDAAAWQLDVATNVVYDDRFSLGLSYRVNDAIALLLGAELYNGIRVGFSYDLVTSAIGYYASGSYEMFVSYGINLKKSRKRKYKSIRYL